MNEFEIKEDSLTTDDCYIEYIHEDGTTSAFKFNDIEFFDESDDRGNNVSVGFTHISGKKVSTDVVMEIFNELLVQASTSARKDIKGYNEDE